MDSNCYQGSGTKGKVREMVDNIIRPGISREEVMKTYDVWATKYEKDISSITIKGPGYVAEETDALFNDKKNVHILDACAGTGRVAQELVKAGFCHIDALDGCDAMLEEAKKLDIYENFYLEYLGSEKLNLSDNMYDAVVTSGSFIPGHVKDDCYEEIIRILKPGGYFVFVMCEHYFTTDPEWTQNIEPHMKDLEDNGKWKKITRRKLKDFHYTHAYDGVLFVLQKL